MSAPSANESPDIHDLLLAEDHDVCRRITLRQLQMMGVATVAVSDGEDAFRVWRTNRPPFVISDFRLPRLNGHELARRIRASEHEHSPPAALKRHMGVRTTLILLSVTMTANDIDAGLKAGFDECLMKPLLGDSLATALARWGVTRHPRQMIRE